MEDKEAIEILKNYHNGYFGYKIDDVHEAHNLAIKALEEKEADKWNFIHSKDDLPKERDWYLGLFKEPYTNFIGLPYICDYVGMVTKGTTNEGWILRHCTDVDNVIDYYRNLICVAWKPLSKPYESEDK